MKNFKDLREKTLTPAEKKKREEIAKAMERENPGMDMKKKMAIATWQAKKVAEETELDEGLYHVSYGVGLDHQVVAKDASDAHQKAMAHFKKTKPKLNDPKYSDTFNKKAITRIKGDEPRSDKYKTEEVEQVDEADGTKRNRELYATGRISKDEFDKRMGYGKYKTKDNSKRLDGPGGIYKNLVKRYNEETELDEISRDLARRYIRKVADKTNTGELSTKEVEKRRPGVHLAGKKAYPEISGKAKVSATEAVEPIDELKKSTLGSYVNKAAADVGYIQRDITSGSVKDPEYKSLSRMRKNRKAGIARAVTSLTKEQAEDDMPASPDEKSMAMSQAKFIEYVAEEIKEYIEKDKPFPEWMQNKLSSLHENAKDMHAVLAGDYEDEDEMEESVTTSPLQKIRMDKEKADRNKDDKDKSQAKRMTDKQYAGYKVKMKEETEELDEISRDLARRYIRKVADKTNTGELSTKQVMKRRPGVNLAGKKAYPGIAGEPRVRATEEVEPIEELSKKTLGSYVKKAKDDLGNREAEVTRNRYVDPRGVADPVKHNNKLLMKRANRRDNINKAVDKLTKEAVQSADRKPEKYVRPDGKVGIRMIKVDKKVIKND